MECSLLKDVDNIVLIDVSEHDLAVAITYYHDIGVERMSIHGSYRTQVNSLAHLPRHLVSYRVINYYFPVSSILILFLQLLLFK